MTSSEQRLHPASILFDIARYARIFAWPALLAYLSGPRRGPQGLDRFGVDASSFEAWLWVLVLPSVVLSIVRYLSFRVRYGPDELVIRSGLFFRNVRHVPYARIQNLDAVQNVFHRALGVVDVRLETGSGGTEPEARLNVLPAAALDDMRARVFAGRVRSDTAARVPSTAEHQSPSPETLPGEGPGQTGSRPPVPLQREPARELLHLTFRDLLLLGFLENKGMVLVGAAYGALWEAGLMDWLWSGLFENTIDARGLYREVVAFLVGRGPLPLGRLALALGGLAGFLVLVRLISMAWAVLRLWGFRLTRSGDDLRVSYGLLTRVTATIPLRRVQTVTVQRGWLHRIVGRASIRVETAGGRAGAATRDREWVAPVITDAGIGSVLAEVLPGLPLAGDDWQPVHPRAFRRAVKPALVAALVPSLVLLALLGWRAALIGAPMVAWAIVSARQHVRHLAWAVSDLRVAFRSGWLSRAETVVRVTRIQGVTLHESPFDRRARMAGVRVDTAGAGEWSHRVNIPYLAVDTAQALQHRLAHAAAQTAFQW
jgi:putative membrane protein